MNSMRILGTLPSTTAFTSSSIRAFSTSTILKAQVSNKKKDGSHKKTGKKKKRPTLFKMANLKELQQYSLCDAIQYIKAFEVGRSGEVPKYDLAIRFRTRRDGPVVRNQIKLPHAVNTDIRICVLVDPESKAGRQAKAAGAHIVGLEEVFAQIKEGKINFDRCLTIPEHVQEIAKAGLPRILGPRGLMPSAKLGTVTADIGEAVDNMRGGSTYRERDGVIRMAIGQLGHHPDQLRENIKKFTDKVKKEASKVAEDSGQPKDLHEVVRFANY